MTCSHSPRNSEDRNALWQNLPSQESRRLQHHATYSTTYYCDGTGVMYPVLHTVGEGFSGADGV
jgi:hypothetical protein